MDSETSTVRVGVRIRPKTPNETVDGCQTCTSIDPDEPQQVWIGGTHAFTYDYVFDTNTSQDSIFQNVKSLVDGCLKGYNATIIAYGQTGSGKTYTMGTGLDMKLINSNEICESQGIVPRALNYLFSEIDAKIEHATNQKVSIPEFRIRAQFIEIYNEEVIDLIGPNSKTNVNRPSGGTGDNELNRMNQRRASNHSNVGVKIHEDQSGGIYLVGVGTRVVTTIDDALQCLRNGVLCRTTASTNMNDKSSRSHAVYTIYLEQRRLMEEELVGNNEEHEILSAKFHFVDLAGSERLKRTGAVGERAKEGISINCGLLSLGNVISALGDKSKKAAHIPYRDSKLTRLLQDSLGGNSRTVMIACVSPCDRDFVETLNTLKYANRARNIKNKVTINQNKSSRTIAMLRQEISLLQMELFESKQGKNAADDTTDQSYFQETVWLKAENEFLQNRVIAMQETIDELTNVNSQLLAEKAASNWTAAGSDLSEIIQKYTLDIEELRGRLFESESTCQILKRKNNQYQKSLITQNCHSLENVSKQISKCQSEHETGGSNEIEETQGDYDNNNTEYIEKEMSEKKEQKNSGFEARGELVRINQQIFTKERLIEQLELSNRRAIDTKEHYEEQIKVLFAKIRRTEDERDSLVSSSSSSPQQSPKSGHLQSRNLVQLRDYENKLSRLQSDMKRMQDAGREHDKLVRKNAATEKQLYNLKQEVESMKRLKVKLMNQLKEENAKWRANESKRLREIAQLKKDQRKKENVIRNLETRGLLNEQLLKRKHEEINMLRRLSKPNLSRRAAGKICGSHTQLFHNAKKRWMELRSEMIRQASIRLTLDALELDLVDALSERTRIKNEITKLKLNTDNGKRTMGTGEPRESSSSEINQFNDDLDTFNASLTYCEEKINEIQSSIMELNSSSPNTNKNDEVGGEIKPYIEVLNREECCYILQKMYEDSLENLSSSKRNSNRLGVLQQENETLSLKVSALQEYIRKHGFNSALPAYLKPYSLRSCRKILSPQMSTRKCTISARPKLQGNSPKTVKSQSTIQIQPMCQKIPCKKSKCLKSKSVADAKPQERISSARGREGLITGESCCLPLPCNQSQMKSSSGRLKVNDITCGILSAPEKEANELLDANNNSIEDKLKVYTIRPALETVEPIPKLFESQEEVLLKQPPVDTLIDLEKNGDSTTIQQIETNSSVKGVPASVLEKIPQTDSTEKETICDSVPSQSYKIIFQHTHSAEGHSKPVLSMFATEDRLFTGSKDSSAKCWDLASGKELRTISGYPTSVSCVKYVADLGLIFTVSSYFIKAHDIRTGTCVRTMTSAGTSFNEDVMFYPNMRMLQIPYGEIAINSMAISSQMNSFYTSFNEKVRLWDMRTFSSVGLLAGRHQGQIMCMSSDFSGQNSLVTGSKDHYIKLYNLEEIEPKQNLNIPPKYTLSPPHDDGIESLALSNGILFSGSRDCCIKKWDLEQEEDKFGKSINNAHSGWVTGLTFSPSNPKNLLSSSRDGLVKVWDVEQCHEIGRMGNLEGGINCISANSSLVFTGSGEDTVGFWKMLESAE